jgi:hypothetical protein
MFRPLMRQLFALCAVGAAPLASGAFADAKLILTQKVQLTGVMVNGMLVIAYVGVGKGPFSNMFPLGICATATCPQVPGVSPVPRTAPDAGPDRRGRGCRQGIRLDRRLARLD